MGGSDVAEQCLHSIDDFLCLSSLSLAPACVHLVKAYDSYLCVIMNEFGIAAKQMFVEGQWRPQFM